MNSQADVAARVVEPVINNAFTEHPDRFRVEDVQWGLELPPGVVTQLLDVKIWVASGDELGAFRRRVLDHFRCSQLRRWMIDRAIVTARSISSGVGNDPRSVLLDDVGEEVERLRLKEALCGPLSSLPSRR